MTHDERFDRIEQNLLTITESQISWQKDIRQAMDGLIASHGLAQKSVATLTESISKYVDASSEFVAESKARTKRLEENLDALIRVITAEHGNGKEKH